MKNIIILMTIGAMVTFGAAKASAQSTNDTNIVTTTVTNVVQTVTIALTGFEQSGSGASPVHLSTKDFLKDLQTATGTTFSPRAKLTAVTPLGGGTTAFIVQDPSNTNSASTDVSGLLSAMTVGTPVAKVRTGSRGKVAGTAYSVESFSYGSTDTNGTPTAITLTDVQGFTTTQLGNGAFNAQVHGTGTHNGNPIVVKGNINGGPGKFQEVSQ
jgi:hypothetical protein